MVTIVLVERGMGVVTHRHGSHETRAGDVVIFEPGAEFRYAPIRPQRISMVMVEQAMLFDTLAWRYAPRSEVGRARVRAVASASMFPAFVVRPDESQVRRLQRLLRTAQQVQAHRAGGPLREEVPGLLAILAQIMEILDPLMLQGHPDPFFTSQIQAAAAVSFPAVRHAGVLRALEFMAIAPAREWSLTVLARQASLSSGYFARVFTTEVGVSPRQFLSDRRLAEFVMLVQATTLTVSQAARQVGWNSTSHAIASFRRRFGVSPQEYRNGLRCDTGESPILPGERLIPPPSVEPDLS